MCGICGIIGKTIKNVHSAVLRRMTNEMVHRGPDSEGYHQNDFSSVGARRLKIIDLKTGDQPIHNEEKNIWVVFNGEIYNFKRLRSNLIDRGHHLYTQSDTEIIVHLYEEYGLQFVHHITGMFAIALIDEKLKRTVLVRDRMGVKPLYYAEPYKGSLVFASEIKSLLASDMVPARVFKKGLEYYLSLQYVPAPYTMFDGIYKIKPGTMLVLDAEPYCKREIVYWQYAFPEQSGVGLHERKSLDEYADELRFLVEDAVRLRMVSDVPVGAFLSGGIDSSIIVGEMTKLSERPVESFTVGFPMSAKRFDELNSARIASSYFHTNHHEIECTADQVYSCLSHLVWHLDEPIAEPLVLPTHFLCEESKKHVTVILTGEGADELFFGYHYYKLAHFYKYMRWIPLLMRRSFYHLTPLSRYSKYERSLRYICGKDSLGRLLGWHMMFNKDEIQNLLMKQFSTDKMYDAGLTLYKEMRNELKLIELSHQAPWFDTQWRLPYFILERADKISMASSLEIRNPFLDYRLAEFASKLPDNLKLQGKGKYLLRYAFRDLLPSNIISLRKKAFAAPVTDWTKSLIKVDAPILASIDDGIFDQNQIKRLFSDFRRSPSSHSTMVWSIIVFDIWYRLFIRKDSFITDEYFNRA